MASDFADGSHVHTGGEGHSFSRFSIGDQARAQLGNITNNTTNNRYTLRQRRSDETLREDERSPLLLKAAAEGQTARIRYLRELGINLDYCDEFGLTALHHAVLSGFEDTVQLLIDFGADVNFESNRYGTPLCLAALKARKNVLDMLFKARASVKASGGDLGSALHCAVSSGDLSAVRLVFEKGSRLDDFRKLQLLLYQPKYADVVLVGTAVIGTLSKICVEEVEDTIFAPLHIAVWNGHLDIADHLLREGANVDGIPSQESNSPGSVTFTPLMIAATTGNQEALRLLLYHNAQVSLKTGTYKTSALMCAASAGQLVCLEKLVQYGAPLEDRNVFGDSSLILSAYRGHSECVQKLTQYGANLEATENGGSTPLAAAVREQHIGTAIKLLDAGADVNAKDNIGCSPLDVAVSNKLYDLAHELARRGAQFSTSQNSYSLIRLLHADTMEYRQFGIFASVVPLPKYSTLSRTWGSEEVLFKDFSNLPVAERKYNVEHSHLNGFGRYHILHKLCEQIKRQSVEWMYADTICIDNSTEAELALAVESMMLWHDKAAKNFIYLQDLVASEAPTTLQRNLTSCRWLARSWSLQDLLVNEPDNVLFFDSTWECIGTRRTLASILSKVMNIMPEHVLNYRKACVAAKLSWYSRLLASREEDRCYAMLGILGLSSVAYNYGEGEHEACRRVQEAIVEQFDDESVFAWHPQNPIMRKSGLLAPTIDCFAGCAALEISPLGMTRRFQTVGAPNSQDRGVKVTVPTSRIRDKLVPVVLTLACGCDAAGPSGLASLFLMHNSMKGCWERAHNSPLSNPRQVEKARKDYNGSLTSIFVPNDKTWRSPAYHEAVARFRSSMSAREARTSLDSARIN